MSPRAEEMLPLYEESQGESGFELKFPDSKATPDDVREYICKIMQSRGISLDHARRVAARWRVGTGQELRSYPVPMFGDIFGPEDGWMLYKEIKAQYYREEDQAISRMTSRKFPILGEFVTLTDPAPQLSCLSFAGEL